MRVAITGGTGYVGTKLTRALEARGDEVLIVRRGEPGVPGVHWNPELGWFAPGTLDGVDAVVHLSGTSIAAQRWTAARKVTLRASRITSTRVLVEHLGTLDHKPSVLVMASASGYFGETGDVARTESGAKGSGFLADLVADWEREGDRATELDVRVVHARFGPMIWRDSELIRRVLLPFSLGVGGTLGNGKQWFSWVATPDVVRALLFAIDHAELSGAVNVTATQPATNAEFTRALGHALHRPAIFPIPALALRLLFGRELADEALLVDQRVVPQRLTDAGFVFEHPTIEGALRSTFATTSGSAMAEVSR